MKSIRMIGTAVIALGLATSASAQEGDPISDSAAIYGTYQSEVTEVKEKPFSSAGDIDNALTSLGGHNPDQLTRICGQNYNLDSLNGK